MNRVVAMADRLPDYDYYIDNYADGQRLMEAAPTVTKYESRNGCLFQMGIPLAYFFFSLPAVVGVSILMGDKIPGD